MTPELDIPKLRADLKAATPGPWATIPPGGPQGDFFGIFNSEKGWIVADRIFGNRPKGEDAAHIVSAHNSFEALLNRAEQADRYEAENTALRQWVSDLLAGTFVNCVYCGHRYGPDDETPVSRSDLLTRHVAACPDHPLAKQIANAKAFDLAVNGVLQKMFDEERAGTIFENRWLAAATRIVLLPERAAALAQAGEQEQAT